MTVFVLKSLQLVLYLTRQIFRITFISKSKHEIKTENFSNRMNNKQIKVVQNNSYGLILKANVKLPIFVDVMNSKRQVKGRLGHVVDIHVCCLL